MLPFLRQVSIRAPKRRHKRGILTGSSRFVDAGWLLEVWNGILQASRAGLWLTLFSGGNWRKKLCHVFIYVISVRLPFLSLILYFFIQATDSMMCNRRAAQPIHTSIGNQVQAKGSHMSARTHQQTPADENLETAHVINIYSGISAYFGSNYADRRATRPLRMAN